MLSSRYATRERDKYKANSPEVQEASLTKRFIFDFQSWLSGQFYSCLRAARSGAPTPTELRELVRPWVDELVGVLEGKSIPTLSASEAVELDGLLNEALDGLEFCYRFFDESSAGMMLALSPIEDILAFLSFRVTRQVAHTVSDGV